MRYYWWILFSLRSTRYEEWYLLCIPFDLNETSIRGKVQHLYTLMQYSSDTKSTLKNVKN